ncbi:hypothetical protein F9843_10750 [Glaesserella parasuis]|nr:hypothetical protein [Glaesserella parasuis]
MLANLRQPQKYCSPNRASRSPFTTMQILGSWSPFTETWLAIKLLLVVVYIVFGVVAQKNIRTPKGFAFYSLSLLAFSTMVLLSLCKIG